MDEAPVTVQVRMVEDRYVGGTLHKAGETPFLRENEAATLIGLGVAVILPPEPVPVPEPEPEPVADAVEEPPAPVVEVAAVEEPAAPEAPEKTRGTRKGR